MIRGCLQKTKQRYNIFTFFVAKNREHIFDRQKNIKYFTRIISATRKNVFIRKDIIYLKMQKI